MQWDVFCRVVDNFGDIGVCWRLAADLGSRGEQVRLWIDDASALNWMAPTGAPGVQVSAWSDSLEATPGDVVIESFGCELPESFVQSMAAAVKHPAWINLEYLSAERYVERSHLLRSPQLSGPGRGLTKRFFYPGFTPKTGGLLREQGLMQAQQQFDRNEWLARHTVAPRPDEHVVSLFSYPTATQHNLFDALAEQSPTLVLLTADIAEPSSLPSGLRCHRLPHLAQHDYDHLLWSCDLNFVRGEDSFVRAQWAGRPFVWHIYPQQDGAHVAKLDAFLDLFPQTDGLRRCWHSWNVLTAAPITLPPIEPWQASCLAWREHLLNQPDLTTQLMALLARHSP